MSTPAIHTENLSKHYRIGINKLGYRTLGETVSTGFRRVFSRDSGRGSNDAESTIWALKDVSITCRRGEITGIIGRNGSGKTTLLKILAGITEPTTGWAEIYGRPGALLEVGTGFHAELTGRENVYMNGAILGMSRREIDRKFDQIVSFAEVERFIDTAVKFYSSGMYLRLAFSVASFLEPDILLVDEVLAVGDAEFQKKCIQRMESVSHSGRTVLFVSHNLSAVQTLCTDGIVLDHGRVVAAGTVTDALTAYTRLRQQAGGLPAGGDRSIDIGDLRIDSGETDVYAGKPVTISFQMMVRRPLLRNTLRLTFRTAGDDVIVYTAPDASFHSQLDRPGLYRLRVHIPPMWLKPGVYDMRVKAVGEMEGQDKIRAVSNPVAINYMHPGLKQIDLPAYVIPDGRWDVDYAAVDPNQEDPA
ncbi:MAG TPA: ABC transporter ATP-binding protein [bacterium]|nr:ABC transporter ATP-binding protein [bacterium]